MTEIDLAMAAAYIDGEGCIVIYTRDSKGKIMAGQYIAVTVSNVDPRLIVWLHSTFGGHIALCYSHKRGRLPVSHWTVKSRKAIEVLELCLPYFKLKREQAEVALRFARTFQGSSGKNFGRGKPRSEELIALRDSLKSELTLLKRQTNSRAGVSRHVKAMPR